jgi:hypothetical protein
MRNRGVSDDEGGAMLEGIQYWLWNNWWGGWLMGFGSVCFLVFVYKES